MSMDRAHSAAVGGSIPTAFPFSFGSQTLPGLAKLAEECGEVQQVIGKLMMTGGAAEHWDGTDLIERLEEEVGDLSAAVVFVTRRAGLDPAAILERTKAKLELFERWHEEQRQEATTASSVGTSEASAPIPAVQSGAVVSKWGAARNLFVTHAERFVNATRYEEASAIADKAAREIEDLFAAPQSEPLPGGVGEAMRKAIAVVLDAAWGEGLNEVQLDEEKHIDAILASLSGKEQSNG